jgi:hypothetical protein
MSVREMRRALALEGRVVVARMGNAAVEPREGYELKLEGYRRLFVDLAHVIIGEDTALSQYLANRTPDLTGTEGDEALARQKWLSVVASPSRDVFGASVPFDTFPHALGRLQINPIYTVDAEGPDGGLDLRLQFPSEWYRFENESYLRYAPERVRVAGDVVRALELRAPHPDLDALIKQCVVIGMPDRYQSTPDAATTALAPSGRRRAMPVTRG